MARVTAVLLRNRARETMMACGGRGFVRFPDRGALLVCDALRRCESEGEKKSLLDAMEQAGFVCHEQDGLLYLTPADEMFVGIGCTQAVSVDWESPLCSAQALASRWLSKERRALTQAGRQLIVDALRLTWQDKVTEGLVSLRAQAAVMQRCGDSSGLHEAGAVLAEWLNMQEGKTYED